MTKVELDICNITQCYIRGEVELTFDWLLKRVMEHAVGTNVRPDYVEERILVKTSEGREIECQLSVSKMIICVRGWNCECKTTSIARSLKFALEHYGEL